jgi:hypothetical protein
MNLIDFRRGLCLSRAAKNKPGANWLHRVHCWEEVLPLAFKVKGLSIG